jgi:hypothetical protein
MVQADDWKGVRDQLNKLKEHNAGSVPAIDEILDDDIRRRFGQVIARAAHKPTVRETLAVVAVAR